MSSIENTPIDRDEVELLLPWYINGTLGADDMARVTAFLATTSEFDAQIASIRDDHAETISANESIRGPSPGALDRLMTDVATEPASTRLMSAAASGLFAQIGSALRNLSPGHLGLASAVAALVICLQAGLLGSGLLQSGAIYETAGPGETSTPGIVVLIEFTPAANIKSIAEFLEKNNARIVSGPENETMFKVRINDETANPSSQSEWIETLRAQNNIVQMAIPSQ